MESISQGELFGGLSRSPETRILIKGTAERPLTKRQKQFARQLRKLEDLRLEYDRVVARWERLLERYTREIRPVELAENRHRVTLVKHLGAAWRGRSRLGSRQRESLARILGRELRAALRIEPGLLEEDETLREIAAAFEETAEKRRREFQEELKRELEELEPEEREEIDELLGGYVESLGLDRSRFSADMTAEEMAEELERQMLEADARDERAQETEASAGFAEKKATAAQKRAAKKAEEREKARQRTLSMIYKQLAKVLHPDLEQDPALRAEKERVMQELTTAHRNRDLHTLLRLELAWLEGESDRLESLTDEKLAIYLDVLREQVMDAEESVEMVGLEPRFQILEAFVRPWSNLPCDETEILMEIQQRTQMLEEAVEALEGPERMEVLRIIIQSEQEQRKIAEQFASLRFPI